MKKLVNGITQDMTSAEIAQRQAEEVAWLASQPSPLEVAMKDLRARRNKALANSDWTVLIDVPLEPAEKSAWMNYRALLRNITNGLETLEQVKAVTLPIPPK